MLDFSEACNHKHTKNKYTSSGDVRGAGKRGSRIREEGVGTPPSPSPIRTHPHTRAQRTGTQSTTSTHAQDHDGQPRRRSKQKQPKRKVRVRALLMPRRRRLTGDSGAHAPPSPHCAGPNTRTPRAQTRWCVCVWGGGGHGGVGDREERKCEGVSQRSGTHEVKTEQDKNRSKEPSRRHSPKAANAHTKIQGRKQCTTRQTTKPACMHAAAHHAFLKAATHRVPIPQPTQP